MDPAQLIDACVQGLASYDPAVSTIDSHVADVLSRHASVRPQRARGGRSAGERGGACVSPAPPQNTASSRPLPPAPPPHIPASPMQASPSDAAFIQQMVYGATRAAPALRVLMNALYHCHASSLVRADYPLYNVLAYLCAFRLPEVGWHRVVGILRRFDVAKMHRLVSFLFDDRLMEEWVKEGWCRVLDRGYVEGTLLASLAKFRPHAKRWLAEHEMEAFGGHASRSGAVSVTPGEEAGVGGTSTSGSGLPPLGDGGSSRASKRPLTVPIPPKLTAPRLRPLPTPLELTAGVSAHPVPDDLDAVTLEELHATASARRAATREATRAKYDPERDLFKLHTTRTTVDRVRAEVESRREAELRFDGFRALPPPPLPPAGADVKLNASALLREDAVFKRKQAADAAIVRRFEVERHDTTEFQARIAAAEAAAEQLRAQTIRDRKRQLEESARAAAAAQRRAAAVKAASVRELKAEAAAIAEARDAERAADVAAHRTVVEAVRQAEAVGPTASKAALSAAHLAAAKESKALSVRLEADRAAAAAVEAAERHDVIRRIRALERAPKISVKTLDPTKTPGYGFLDEMSLVELRERLAIAQARDAEELEEKRLRLLAAKRDAEEVMLARARNMADLRQTAALASRQARATRKEEEAKAAEEVEEERKSAALEVAHRLEAKRAAQTAERERLEAERKRIATENQVRQTEWAVCGEGGGLVSSACAPRLPTGRPPRWVVVVVCSSLATRKRRWKNGGWRPCSSAHSVVWLQRRRLG